MKTLKYTIPILSVLVVFGILREVDARLYNPQTTTGGDLTLNGDLLPGANNTYDIGAYGSAWKDIYASGTLQVGSTGSGTSSFANGIQLSSGCFLMPNGTCVGSSGANTALSNLASVAINTSLLPGTANTLDLGSFSFPWANIYASGTIYASAFGPRLTSSSTVTLSASYTPATGTRSNLKDFVMPFDCTIGEIVMNATSTFGVFPTIIDVNKQTSMGVGTGTLFTTQTARPQLGDGGLTTSTVPAVTALSKGNVLSFDIDQYGGQLGLDIQIICAKPLSH